MIVKRISLIYLKMALHRTRYLRKTRAIAVSNNYRPIAGRDGEQLHGECLIVRPT